MDRKTYLLLCQRHAVGEKVFVIYDKSKYIPERFEIWFDKYGKPHNAGRLKDIKSKSSYVVADIERIEIDE